MTNDIGWHHPIDEADQWDGFNEPGIEHFAGSPIRHLAREVNQNSLDSADAGTVRVRMRHRQVETASIPNVDELRRSVALCKEAAKEESPKAEQFFVAAAEELEKKKISILEVSDSNTQGMRGPAKNGTPFYAFMKAKGQSRKDSATATGSFGIGKFAPYAVSKLRTVFVSTVFQNPDGVHEQLTQGKSILMSHDDAGTRRQGAGFWGTRELCQPVGGVRDDIPAWIQRVTREKMLSKRRGTTLSIIGFDSVPGWQENLAVSVAENFFGAINAGKLEVDVDGRYCLDKASIMDFFGQADIRLAIEGHKNEPDQFDNCGRYLRALQDGSEVIIEESERLHLGLCQLRIFLGEGLPKKVCVLRNGMFISDSLSLAGLNRFSDFKEFVAVVECKTKKGVELLRAMEPPRHDDFEPERLAKRGDQKRGAKALKDLASWIREMLKRHAKDPVSEVTTLDELSEYFADESGEAAGKGTEEMDPSGKIIIRAKPIKSKSTSAQENGVPGSVDNDTDDEAEGAGGKGKGKAGESGRDPGVSEADRGYAHNATTKASIAVENVRALVGTANTRRISFTPLATGNISVAVLEAGADSDYGISITATDNGAVKDGKIIVDVTAKRRVTMNVTLSDEFKGALKVVAHAV